MPVFLWGGNKNGYCQIFSHWAQSLRNKVLMKNQCQKCPMIHFFQAIFHSLTMMLASVWLFMCETSFSPPPPHQFLSFPTTNLLWGLIFNARSLMPHCLVRGKKQSELGTMEIRKCKMVLNKGRNVPWGTGRTKWTTTAKCHIEIKWDATDILQLMPGLQVRGITPSGLIPAGPNNYATMTNLTQLHTSRCRGGWQRMMKQHQTLCW